MMDDARIAEIEARLTATTPGPWRHGSLSEDLLPARPLTEVIGSEEVDADDIPGLPPAEGLSGCRVTHTYTVAQPYQHVSEREADGDGERREWTDWLCRCEADARFFAHARQDIADLLAEVNRLRKPDGA